MVLRTAVSAALRGGLAAVGVLAFSIAPAGAEPAASPTCPAPIAGGVYLELSNPHVGDQLPAGGGYTLQGIAYDTQATSGTGISRVSLTMESVSLGDATLGQLGPGPGPKGAFSATVQLPKPSDLNNQSKTHFLTATAYPDSGGSVSFWVPVSLGPISSSDLPPAGSCALLSTSNRPTTTLPAPVPIAPAAAPATNPSIAADGQTLAMQAPDLQALFVATFGVNAAVEWATQHNAAIGAAAPAPAPAPALAPAITAPLSIQLTVQNPHAGDTLPIGGYVVNGVAYDPSDLSTPGITRIQVYLDSRDNGGTLLGEGQVGLANSGVVSGPTAKAGFAITIKTTTGMAGAHGLYVYADANSGATTYYGVPVLVPSNPT